MQQPVALLTASVRAASDLRMTSAFSPSARLITLCFAPSLSRICSTKELGRWKLSRKTYAAATYLCIARDALHASDILTVNPITLLCMRALA